MYFVPDTWQRRATTYYFQIEEFSFSLKRDFASTYMPSTLLFYTLFYQFVNMNDLKMLGIKLFIVQCYVCVHNTHMLMHEGRVIKHIIMSCRHSL